MTTNAKSATSMLEPLGSRPPTKQELCDALAAVAVALEPFELLAMNLRGAAAGDRGLPTGELALTSEQFGDLALIVLSARRDANFLLEHCREIMDHAETLVLDGRFQPFESEAA